MSQLLGIIFLAMAPQKPALFVCDLDDCQVSSALHQVAEVASPQDRWSWMNHDLALARAATQRGQNAKAIRLSTNLDRAIRSGLSQLLIDRGTEQVTQLHASLQDIVKDCKGHALEPLNLAMDPIVRHTALPRVKTPAQ
jgi:hypothetical protein